MLVREHPMVDPALTPLDELADRILQAPPTWGSAVHEASAAWGVGAGGDPVVRLTVVLDDPEDGVSWDPQVELDLQSTALGLARQLGIDEFVFVDLLSRSEAAEEEDENDGLSDFRQRLDEEFPEDGDRPSDSQR